MQITLMISALAQGLVSMHRAGRVGSDEQFCATCQVAMDRLLTSFMKSPALYRNTDITKSGK